MGWPHLGPSCRGRGCGGPHSERTGGPAPGARRTRQVGQDRLAGAGGAGTAAAAADLQGVAGAGLGQGPEPAEADAAEQVEHAGQRAAGDAAQCRAQTPGIDGEVALTSEARADIAVRVHQSVSSWQPRAVKRVYIPKAGDKKKLRPLGIPVILDR